MARFKHAKPTQDTDHQHRWLVSYADYMTLMFAFFVVMYAMAILEEEQYSVISSTISDVFESSTEKYNEEAQAVNAEGILVSNQVDAEQTLYGVTVIEQDTGPELVDGKGELTNLKQKYLGQPLDSLEEDLTRAISDELETGQAQLEKDKDWLTIELSSSLLFASGSSVPTQRARNVLRSLMPVLNANNNYLRVRGYTDNRPINNEIFPSNWHLSVSRATEILVWLEFLGINPARMAIEGYGEHSPFSENASELGRQQNRKVIIAISKYALPSLNSDDNTNQQEQKTTLQQIEQLKQQSQDNNEVQVIQLPNGGIRITTREQEQEQ